jgi:hypothetical protein
MALGNNSGALRKNLWSHLEKEYSGKVDYRDFLLSVGKLLEEGKMRKDAAGVFSMHPQIMKELNLKVPTPAALRSLDYDSTAPHHVLVNLIRKNTEDAEPQEIEIEGGKQGFLVDYVRKKDRRYFKEEDSLMDGSTMASRLGF